MLDANAVSRDAIVTSRPPPKGSPAYQAQVIADILAAAQHHGQFPRWTQCRDRFRLSSATTTKYRNAALKVWHERRARLATAGQATAH